MEFVRVNTKEIYRGCFAPRNKITFITTSVCNVRTYNLMTIISIDGQINGVCRGEQ